VIATGTPEDVCKSVASHTAEYLRPKLAGAVEVERVAMAQTA
jgi:hypothetical protein